MATNEPQPYESPLPLLKTGRGFIHADFTDADGRPCLIRDSSAAMHACLRLGVEADFDGRPIPAGRMHIGRNLARKLGTMLLYFAEHGTIDPNGGWEDGPPPDAEDEA